MKKIIFLFSLSLAFLWYALGNCNSAIPSKKICLNMIVKDESKVILRCLGSVKKHIDYWVIVDTGSTDGTQKMIRDFMKDIPGELHERPWINFEHNRNEALTFAQGKGDYVLFLDADEQLMVPETFTFPNLDKDCYVFRGTGTALDFYRTSLINMHLPGWKWEGVIHERIMNPQAQSSETFSEVVILHAEGGHRSEDPNKYRKDAKVLEEALKKDPGNSRYVYFLGMSYWCCKEYELALKYFQQRAEMQGWDEEVFWSLYSIGQAQQMLKMSSDVVTQSYLKAYQFDQRRAEPLYRLAVYFREKGNHFLGFLVANFACSLPMPEVRMLRETWIYDYGLLEETANCLYEMGKYHEALKICDLIISKNNVPQEVKLLIENNRRFLYSKSQNR